MSKIWKYLKLAAIILVVSLVISKFPGLIYGSAKAIVWTAQTITGTADAVLASGGK